MVIDKKSNILTDLEFRNVRIADLSINIENTKSLAKHMDELVENLEKTSEYKKCNDTLDIYLKEIKKSLPRNKSGNVTKLDDCYTEMLILYGEYFYKHGYYDSLQCNKLIKRIKSWFKQRYRKWGSKGGKYIQSISKRISIKQ